MPELTLYPADPYDIVTIKFAGCKQAIEIYSDGMVHTYADYTKDESPSHSMRASKKAMKIAQKRLLDKPE